EHGASFRRESQQCDDARVGPGLDQKPFRVLRAPDGKRLAEAVLVGWSKRSPHQALSAFAYETADDFVLTRGQTQRGERGMHRVGQIAAGVDERAIQVVDDRL